MYPLVFVFGTALLHYDDSVLKYSAPLVGVGLFFAIYHNLLHFDIIPESAVPCSQGVPCSTKYIELFGFITIPMLSLIAFSAIAILLLIVKRNINK